MPENEELSIAEVSARTGLSRDTLRWYESEGLIPAVPRNSAGIRRYDDASVRMIELLVRLRRTGMSVAHMRDFVTPMSSPNNPKPPTIRSNDDGYHRTR